MLRRLLWTQTPEFKLAKHSNKPPDQAQPPAKLVRGFLIFLFLYRNMPFPLESFILLSLFQFLGAHQRSCRAKSNPAMYAERDSAARSQSPLLCSHGLSAPTHGCLSR